MKAQLCIVLLTAESVTPGVAKELFKEVEVPVLPIPGMSLYLGEEGNEVEFYVEEHGLGWVEKSNSFFVPIKQSDYRYEDEGELNEYAEELIRHLGFQPE